ncbi:MAG: MarR family transcriptional regulator [Thermoleophilia bacterium]|nr:MarR family transcriptional regulator [Thermoleophilia bacterium]
MLGSQRSDLPALIDHVSIAMESLRTQWRTVADLGTHERMAISQLRVHGPMPMSELAARISLSRAAVTSLIDRLESENWVRRQPDEHDRRRTVLTLLARSGTTFTSVSEDFDEQLERIAHDMSDDEWRAVARFLGTLNDVAQRQADRLRSTAVERSLN